MLRLLYLLKTYIASNIRGTCPGEFIGRYTPCNDKLTGKYKVNDRETRKILRWPVNIVLFLSSNSRIMEKHFFALERLRISRQKSIVSKF